MRNKNILILSIFSIIFGLNFIWEIAQSFLYAPHYEGFWSFMGVHIRASLGDVLIYGFIYLSGWFIFKNRKWFLVERKYPYIFLIFMSFCLAIIIENFSLRSNRWAYNDLMPIIPLIKVGIAPVLQLVVLSPIIKWLFTKYYKKYFS